MSEAIKLIENKLLELRNTIQGTEKRLESAAASTISETENMDLLRKREAHLEDALIKLRA